MARTDTLPNFLTDVADAIREKTGSEGTILASDFDTEIANIQSGSDISEYFVTTIDSTPINGFSVNEPLQFIKKTPEIVLTENVTKINTAFARYNQSVAPKLVSEGTITQIYNLFSEAKIESADLSGITSCTATDMSGLFQNCSKLRSVKFGNFDTSSATSMTSMFTSCPLLTTVDMDNFKTSNVNNMNAMFTNCQSIVNLDLSSFDTSNVTNMNSMFSNCQALSNLNLSSFETQSLTNAGYMFSNCRALQHLDIRNMIFSSITSYNNMFGSSSSNGVPDNCEIIVKSDTEKNWITSNFSRLTNVKTVAEYGS